jgi:hypothetical protein
MRAPLGLLVAPLVAGLVVAACGSSGTTASSTTTAPIAAPPTTAAPLTAPPTAAAPVTAPPTTATAPPPAAPTIPNVVGMNLDRADEILRGANVTYQVTGGGTFGVVVKSFWMVCSQTPTGSASVNLGVARTC